MSSERELGVALITGASSGIGETYAERLARRGYDLILVARNEEKLEALAKRLTDTTGAKVETLRADLISKADRARVEERLRGDERITMLVNNAGAAAKSRIFAEADLDELEDLIQLNAVAVMRLAGAAVSAFVKRGGGTIVNVGSVTALSPETFNGTYSGTKAFVLNLSLAINTEVGDKGVRVQAVLPGATRTPIWERAGLDVESLPPEIVMDVEEMVDAALVGLDRGELVTIPSLPDAADWEAFTAARMKLGPNLSRQHAAARYTPAGSAGA